MARASSKSIAFVISAAATTVLAAPGCSFQPADSGHLSLAMSLPAGLAIGVVTYALNSSKGDTLVSGSIDVTDPNATVSARVSVPPGTGDTVTFAASAATDAGTSVACGPTTSPAFNIIAGQTTDVRTTLNCGSATTSSGPGTVNVTINAVAGDDVCPSISFVAVAPDATFVGEDIALTAAATDPDVGDTLAYQWFVGQQALSVGTSALFTCAASDVGAAVPLRLVVGDDHAPASCQTEVALAASCLAR
jgi:hypothetical protein